MEKVFLNGALSLLLHLESFESDFVLIVRLDKLIYYSSGDFLVTQTEVFYTAALLWPEAAWMLQSNHLSSYTCVEWVVLCCCLHGFIHI